MIDPKVRKKVPNEHVRPAKLLTQCKKDAANDEQAKIRQRDQLCILGLVQWT
jgi:hypothetical protein